MARTFCARDARQQIFDVTDAISVPDITRYTSLIHYMMFKFDGYELKAFPADRKSRQISSLGFTLCTGHWYYEKGDFKLTEAFCDWLDEYGIGTVQVREHEWSAHLLAIRFYSARDALAFRLRFC